METLAALFGVLLADGLYVSGGVILILLIILILWLIFVRGR
jgi:hypothetical protein